jgi:hypothetical protein
MHVCITEIEYSNKKNKKDTYCTFFPCLPFSFHLPMRHLSLSFSPLYLTLAPKKK